MAAIFKHPNLFCEFLSKLPQLTHFCYVDPLRELYTFSDDEENEEDDAEEDDAEEGEEVGEGDEGTDNEEADDESEAEDIDSDIERAISHFALAAPALRFVEFGSHRFHRSFYSTDFRRGVEIDRNDDGSYAGWNVTRNLSALQYKHWGGFYLGAAEELMDLDYNQDL